MAVVTILIVFDRRRRRKGGPELLVLLEGAGESREWVKERQAKRGGWLTPDTAYVLKFIGCLVRRGRGRPPERRIEYEGYPPRYELGRNWCKERVAEFHDTIASRDYSRRQPTLEVSLVR